MISTRASSAVPPVVAEGTEWNESGKEEKRNVLHLSNREINDVQVEVALLMLQHCRCCGCYYSSLFISVFRLVSEIIELSGANSNSAQNFLECARGKGGRPTRNDDCVVGLGWI